MLPHKFTLFSFDSFVSESVHVSCFVVCCLTCSHPPHAVVVNQSIRNDTSPIDTVVDRSIWIDTDPVDTAVEPSIQRVVWIYFDFWREDVKTLLSTLMR